MGDDLIFSQVPRGSVWQQKQDVLKLLEHFLHGYAADNSRIQVGCEIALTLFWLGTASKPRSSEMGCVQTSRLQVQQSVAGYEGCVISNPVAAPRMS